MLINSRGTLERRVTIWYIVGRNVILLIIRQLVRVR